jgi:short subunit dehydrogenase-like uncharacterized protein
MEQQPISQDVRQKKLMIYGATGYTGRLALDLYFQQGGDKTQIVIAGRESSALIRLSQKYDVAYKIFNLKIQEVIDQHIMNVHNVLLTVKTM